MTATLPSKRTSRAAGCALFALLCLLTTALFALVDATASYAGPAAGTCTHAKIAVAAQGDRPAPSTFADRSATDADNPFEHGRLPLADESIPVSFPVPSRTAAANDVGPISAEASLPERPPRA